MALIALACFFLSGASGLVFEMVWTRELGLVFGSTTLAISTVLSVFMGGLALGSALAGRVADRLRRPLVVYALVEAAVGIYGLAVPLLLSRFPAVNALLYRLPGAGGGDTPVALAVGRFAATALLLLAPTTAMGATLPLLSRYLVARQSDFGRLGVRVGALYTANTLGAVVGTFGSGFVLLPEVGVRATNAAAACTNLALAAVILVANALSARRGTAVQAPDPAAAGVLAEEDPEVMALPGDAAAPVPALDDAPDEPDTTGEAGEADEADEIGETGETGVPSPIAPRARAVALYAFGFSGAAAMTYQVLWSRALAIVIGSSVYSFTLILLAFLVGLAAGAAVVARLTLRARDPVTWLAAIHLGVVAMVVGSYLCIDKLPAAFVGLLRGGSFTVDGVLGIQFVLAAMAILPATLFMGGVMPLTVRIVASGLDRVGRDVGAAWSVNTLGSIAGSFAAGFVVLPRLGLQRGIFLAAIISAAVSGALFLVSGLRRPALRYGLAGGGLALTIAAAALLPRWDLGHFQSGLFRVSYARDIISSGNWPIPELLYYKDGISTSVSVERWGKHLALKNNGKVDASNGDDMSTQILVGLMPLLFHPTALDRPPRALVIGYGSGVTIGAVTQFPIAHADVVELEPEIVRGAKWFAGREPGWPIDVNHRPDENPRVRLILDDGRNVLQRSKNAKDKYDVIVSEPSNPWITGVSNLFTRDYWELARSRLAEDGVFCQWAQLYEMSPANIKTLLGTFGTVFPHTYVFAAEDLSSDVILVATLRPLPLDRARLARNFTIPALKAELQRAEVESADDLLANLLLTPDELPAYTAGAALNTDDNARIEFAAPRDLIGFLGYDRYLVRVYGAGWPYGRIEPWLTGLSPAGGGPSEEAGSLAALAEALLAHGKQAAADRVLKRAQRRCPDCAEVARVGRLVSLLGERPRGEYEVPLDGEDDPLDPPAFLGALPAAEADRRAAEWTGALAELRRHRWAHALTELKPWPEKQVDAAGKDVALTIGLLLYKVEMPGDALDFLKPLSLDAEYCKRRPAAMYYEARALYDEGLFAPGVRDMKKFIALSPPPPAPGATVPPMD